MIGRVKKLGRMPDMSETSSRERTKRIKMALSCPMTVTLCPILGHIFSSDPRSQLSGELRSASGSCQAMLTGDTRKYWSNRCLPGVTEHDPVLEMIGGKFTVSKLDENSKR